MSDLGFNDNLDLRNLFIAIVTLGKAYQVRIMPLVKKIKLFSI